MKLRGLIWAGGTLLLAVYSLDSIQTLTSQIRDLHQELNVTHQHMRELEMRTKFLEEKVCDMGRCS